MKGKAKGGKRRKARGVPSRLRGAVRPAKKRNVRKTPPRDAKGRFVSKSRVRTDYVREIEALRRDLERLKREGEATARDIERNYKRRGGAYEQFVDILAIGQRVKIDKWLDEVYDGKISKDDFVTMAVNTGLSVREAWAVLYS